ncbi:hypothetical protein FXO38_14859 [Capsicum annuum]|nr:hypothetical protein FXO38_14859 [Capsicum annuum]
MISKGCVYHPVQVKDSSSETSVLESVLVVREFPDVFPENLPRVPIEREINFGIDLFPDTQPIFIPPYRMAPTELKEPLELTICSSNSANVVTDSLSMLSMSSVAHLEEDKKKLVGEVHQLARLGVWLVDSTEGIIFRIFFGCRMEDYTKLYLRELVKLHGIPLSIISDRGTQFTTHFWKTFQKGLGTQVHLRTTFHPQIDGQAERTIQTLEDMLRACFIDLKGVKRFSKKGKISPHYFGLYRILSHFRNVSYELEFPTVLATVHSVFHVSLLKKYIGGSAVVVPLEDVDVKDSISFEKVLVKILDHWAGVARVSPPSKAGVTQGSPPLQGLRRPYPFCPTFVLCHLRAFGSIPFIQLIHNTKLGSSKSIIYRFTHKFSQENYLPSQEQTLTLSQGIKKFKLKTQELLKEPSRIHPVRFGGSVSRSQLDNPALLSSQCGESLSIEDILSLIQLLQYFTMLSQLERCRSPIEWFEVGELDEFGLDFVRQAMEKVKVIQYMLKASQSHQKSYADMRVGSVAYELDLPSSLSSIHPVFHISMYKKCIGDPSQVMNIKDIGISDSLSNEEIPRLCMTTMGMGGADIGVILGIDSQMEGELIQEEKEVKYSNKDRNVSFLVGLQTTPPIDEESKNAKLNHSGNRQVREEENLSRIAGFTRKPICVNQLTVEVERISYGRVLIEKVTATQVNEKQNAVEQKQKGKDILVDEDESFPSLQQVYQMSPRNTSIVSNQLSSKLRREGQPHYLLIRLKHLTLY